MPYELTQIRAHLQRFMKEIGDVLTTPEDLAAYEDFCSKIKNLERAPKHQGYREPAVQPEQPNLPGV